MLFIVFYDRLVFNEEVKKSHVIGFFYFYFLIYGYKTNIWHNNFLE